MVPPFVQNDIVSPQDRFGAGSTATKRSVKPSVNTGTRIDVANISTSTTLSMKSSSSVDQLQKESIMGGPAKPSPLTSWNDGATKSQILDFVARVTQQGGRDFIPPAGAHRRLR